MAQQRRLKASLESREGDERLPVALLAEIGIFKYFKPDKLAEFPGSVVLRRYKETETICREGDAGWTAFYIVPAEDMLGIRKRQLEEHKALLAAVVGESIGSDVAVAVEPHDGVSGRAVGGHRRGLER